MGRGYTYMWQNPTFPQGNKTWKGKSTKSVVPIWSKPYANTSYFQKRDIIPSIGPSFKARPIRHWRKQLEPRDFTNRGKTGIGMPMDRPGGQSALVYHLDDKLENDKECKNQDSIHISEYILKNNYSESKLKNIPPSAPLKILNRDKYNPELIDRANPKVVCTACNAEANVIKSGIVNFNENYSDNTASYLESRCKTFEKNILGIADPDTITNYPNGKITWPDDTDKGPQVRIASNCHRKEKNNINNPNGNSCKYKIIYKPNNIKFGKQGGVSSSSRIQRLKYDRLTNNGSQFISSRGATETNDGLFLFDAMSQYFIKTKYQSFITRRKPGNHTNCFFTPTGSVGGKSVPPSQKVLKPTPPPPPQKYTCGIVGTTSEGQCLPDPKGIFLAGDCDRCIKASTGCSNCTDPNTPCYNPNTGICAKMTNGACDGQKAGIINCRDVGKTPCEICPAKSEKPCYDRVNGLCLSKNDYGNCPGQKAGVINCDNKGKTPCEICQDPAPPCYNPETGECIGYSNAGICTGGLVDCGKHPSPDAISCTQLPTGTPPTLLPLSNGGITIFFEIKNIGGEARRAVFANSSRWTSPPRHTAADEAQLGGCVNEDDPGSSCNKLALTCVAEKENGDAFMPFAGKIWRYKGGSQKYWILCTKPTECLS